MSCGAGLLPLQRNRQVLMMWNGQAEWSDYYPEDNLKAA